MYDVLIIGAGVSGAATARELSRYKMKICVLEKEEDVCCGTSKANSGIVHAGYDAAEGSLMAKLNVEGNRLMPELARELDFEFVPCGSMVVCCDEKRVQELEALCQRGIKNNVPGLEIITDKDRIHKMKPNISDNVAAVLYAPTAGVVCPFGLNIALAENAYTNGVEFRFNTEVIKINRSQQGWVLETNHGLIETKVVVNAAGVYADYFHNMVSEKKIHITPRRGEYILLDKKAGKCVTSTIFALPDKLGKGVLVTRTAHGNLLLGPTAADIRDREDTSTTRAGLDEVIEKATLNVKDIPMRQVITSFSGLRAHADGHEFIIEEVEDAPGFIDCAGIESPGLTSCPAIGRMVANIVKNILKSHEKTNFIGTRKSGVHPKRLTKEEYSALVKEQPAYGTVVCRCEMITEGEIRDAIRRPLGAKSLDGIKRRVRATAGRCQGGFCTPRVMEILSDELGIPMIELTKKGGKSTIVVGADKEEL